MERISDEKLDWLIHDCGYNGIETEVNAAGSDDDRDYDCDDLIAALQELKERRAADDKWISVKDRLPEIGQFVDIYNSWEGRVPVVRYEGEGDWSSQYMNWTGRATHWMPLPKPPKEEVNRWILSLTNQK